MIVVRLIAHLIDSRATSVCQLDADRRLFVAASVSISREACGWRRE
jgi:hypothetical protein